MNIKPVASPHAIAPQPTSNQTSARAKAMEAFMGGQQGQSAPVPVNANAISAEDLGSIRATTRPEQTQEATAPSPEAQSPSQEAPTRPKVEDTPAARQFAKLAQREKQLRQRAQQQEEAYKAREAQLQAREAELNAKYKNYDTDYIPKSKLQSDALRILAEAGVPYDQLTQQLISETTTPRDPRTEAVISELKAQIQELKMATEQQKQAAQEQQTQAYKAAVKQIETDVRQLVSMDPAFETIKATGATRDVVELIERTYKEDGRLLTVEEACKEVEDYLFEQTYKLTQLNKIKSKLTESSAKSKPAGTTPQQQVSKDSKQPQPIKTLTNNVASSRPLTAKERAVLAFKGELKS